MLESAVGAVRIMGDKEERRRGRGLSALVFQAPAATRKQQLPAAHGMYVGFG